MSRALRKGVFGHLRTAKAQIILHSLIRAFADRHHLTLEKVSMNGKFPDEVLRMRGMNLNLCILRMFEDIFFA